MQKINFVRAHIGLGAIGMAGIGHIASTYHNPLPYGEGRCIFPRKKLNCCLSENPNDSCA